MKILHLADLHIGRYFNGLSLLADQTHVLEQILKLAKAKAPDVIVIAGDVYDRAVPREDAVKVYNDFLTRLVTLGRKTLIISGNHDSPERLGVLSTLLEHHGLYIEGEARRPLRCIHIPDEEGVVEFYLMPYRDTLSLKATYDLMSLREDRKVYERILHETVRRTANRKVLVYHGFVTPGGEGGAMESDSERILAVGGHDHIPGILFKDFHYVALGHLHAPQWVESGKIRYAGSPLKYSFSEEHHRKSVSLVHLDGAGNVEVEELPLTPLHDVVTVRGRFEDLMNGAPLPGATTDYLRVILEDQEEIPEPMLRLRSRFPHVLELLRERDLPKDVQGEADYDLIRRKDVKELFKDYYRQRNDREMDAAKEAIVDEAIRIQEERRHATD